MNSTMEMVLKWARDTENMRLIAYGWLLRDEMADVLDNTCRLDKVERQYVHNIINARRYGVSA